MANINFYLKKPELTTGKSLIFLQFKYGGRYRLVFSFGQSINPKNWNAEKQRVKNNKATTADGKHYLNDLLDNLERECQRAYNAELKNGVPTPTMLRQYLVRFINQNEATKDKPTLYDLFARFISGEIKYKGKDKSKRTIKTYN